MGIEQSINGITKRKAIKMSAPSLLVTQQHTDVLAAPASATRNSFPDIQHVLGMPAIWRNTRYLVLSIH